MGLLGVLRLGAIDARLLRDIAVAVEALDRGAPAMDGVLAQDHAVGPHIGDQADCLAAQVGAFVELLGQAHGAARAQAQLARGFLLQGRGREGRAGMPLDPLLLELADGENRASQSPRRPSRTCPT